MIYNFDEKQIIEDIDIFVENNKQAVIDDIKAIVNIPSVEGQAEPGAPFGAQVNKALLATLKIADDFNLSTCNMDGFFGYADLKGKSEKQIGIISHLDVVPAGNGWSSDPFDCIEKDNYLIGRGVYDDKGPAILSLYAAKFFEERKETLPYTLRILLGTNEESGMLGLSYYLKHEKPPEFCFTPDGNFPLGYGEKGLYGGTLISDILNGNIIEISGGVADNVVPDRAFAIIKKPDIMPEQSNEVKVEDLNNGTIKLKSFGKGGHASVPEGTINAIAVLVKFILDNKLSLQKETEFLTALYKIISDTSGESIGINATDDVFTPLTCVGGVISFENGIIKQTFDVRYPTSITAHQITEKMSEVAKTVNAIYEQSREVVPFVTSKESVEVKALCKAYCEITNNDKQPFTMGGGTYARHFPRAVSFGPEEKDEVFPDFIGPIHGANEGAKIENLLQALKIYILGVARLMQTEY